MLRVRVFTMPVDRVFSSDAAPSFTRPADQNRRFSIFFSFLFEAIFFVTAELVLNNRLNFSLKGFPLY